MTISTNKKYVMGILNITPDSFFNNSKFNSENEIVSRINQIIEEGGDIIDVGGFSTRPGHDFVTEEEELKRITFALNVIRKNFPEITISVDTFRSNIANIAVKNFNTNIINDISGGQLDDKMFETIAKLNVPYILMHTKVPLNANNNSYNNIFKEIFSYFADKIKELNSLGVNQIIIDPGFGFSKNLIQNYELFNKMDGFKDFNLPLMVGISRKRMIWELLNSTIEDCINGTTALNVLALTKGANILRVHDVREAVEAIKIYNTVTNPKNIETI